MTTLPEIYKILLRFAAEGDSNAEIAQRLELSERTVKNRFTGLYKLIKARNRAHAVAIAITRKWITLPKN